MSIKTSSMDSSQTITKDIGINTRRIARTIPPEKVKKDNTRSNIESILAFIMGLLYAFISIVDKEPVSHIYHIYSIVFSILFLVIVGISSVIFQKRNIDDKSIFMYFVPVIIIGVVLNISMWFTMVAQQTYNSSSIGEMFAHTTFLICFSYILFDYKKHMY